jgi:hypothetical protein
MKTTMKKRITLSLLSLALLLAVIFGLSASSQARTFGFAKFASNFGFARFEAFDFTAFNTKSANFDAFEDKAFSGQEVAFQSHQFEAFDFRA